MSDNPYLGLSTRDEYLFWVFTQTCSKEMMSRMRSYTRILPGNHFSLWYTFWWCSVGFCLISGFQAYENHIVCFDFKRSSPNYINSKALLPHKFQETLKEIPNTIDLGVLITTAGNLICSLISFPLSFPSLCLHSRVPKRQQLTYLVHSYYAYHINSLCLWECLYLAVFWISFYSQLLEYCLVENDGQ